MKFRPGVSRIFLMFFYRPLDIHLTQIGLYLHTSSAAAPCRLFKRKCDRTSGVIGNSEKRRERK